MFVVVLFKHSLDRNHERQNAFYDELEYICFSFRSNTLNKILQTRTLNKIPVYRNWVIEETKKSRSLDYYSSITIQMYNNDINQIE